MLGLGFVASLAIIWVIHVYREPLPRSLIGLPISSAYGHPKQHYKREAST